MQQQQQQNECRKDQSVLDVILLLVTANFVCKMDECVGMKNENVH